MPDYIHPELENLAKELDEKKRGEVAEQCLDDFKTDLESRTEWLSMHAEWLKLYYQKDKPINPPWEGSSDESLPMLAEACQQFHSRAYQAMFPAQGSILKAMPAGKWDAESAERAKRIGTHMSWQLTTRQPAYRRGKDRMLLGLPLHGAYYTKTYRDPVKGMNVTDNVRPTDLVLPYGNGPMNIEDLDRKSHIVWQSVNTTKLLAKSGFFLEGAEPFEFDTENDLDQTHNEIQGLQETAYGKKTTAKIIEQHCLLDLDDDGIAEPYIVWLDSESEKVLRIAIRYDTDEAGNPTDDKNPVEYFTDYSFLENPNGVYGLGYGHLVGPLNSAVNKLLRQAVDAGTLQNTLSMSGFISKQAGVKGGEVKLQLGKFIKTESSADDLNKMFWQPRVNQPAPVLLEVLNLLMGRSDRIAAVEVATGQTQKVMQPHAIMALIEQSQQSNVAAYDRTIQAWGRELSIHYRLNRKYLDPVEYYATLDDQGEMQQAEIARQDYAEDFQVMPMADARHITKQQKIAKGQLMYETIVQNPIMQMFPDRMLTALRKYLETAEVEYAPDILPTPEELMQVLQAQAAAAKEEKDAAKQAGAIDGATDIMGSVTDLISATKEDKKEDD